MASELEGRLQRLRTSPGDRNLFQRLVVELRQAGRDELLAEAFELHANSLSGDDAIRLHLTLAERLSHGAPERAGRAWNAAFAKAWANRDLFSRMEQDAEARGVPAAMQSALQTRMTEDTDPRGRARAARALADLATESSDWELARQAWFTWGAASPSNAEQALAELDNLRARPATDFDTDRACEELARAAQDERSLLRVMDARLGRLRDASGDEYASLCMELAQLSFRVSRDAATAMDYLHRAVDREASQATSIAAWLSSEDNADLLHSPEACAFMRAAAELSGDWSTVAAWFDEEARLTADPVRRSGVLLAKGDMLANKAGESDSAIAAWTAAAGVHGDVQGAVSQRLEQLRSGGGQVDAAKVLQAQRAMFERSGDWGGLHALLRAAAAGERSAASAALFHELGELEMVRLGRPDLAVTSFGNAASIADGDVLARSIGTLFDLAGNVSTSDEASATLARILEERGRWSDLVRLRRRQVEVATDSIVRAQLYAEIAQLQAEQLQQPLEAAQSWARAAELRPDDIRYQDQARHLLMAAGEHEKVLELVRRESMQTPSNERRAELLGFESRLLVDHLNDPAGALDAVYEGFSYAPSDAGLLAVLDHLIATTPELPELVRGLVAGLLDREDPGGAQFILWTTARRSGLDTSDGLSCAVLAAQVLPMDLERLHEVERAARSSEDAETLRTVVGLLAPVEADPAHRLELYRELGQMQLTTGDVDAAVASLQFANQLSNGALLDRIAVADALERSGNSAGWAMALEDLVDDDDLAAEARVRRLAQLAEVYTSQLGELDRGYERWRQLLALEPRHERALAAVASIAEMSGDARRNYDALLQTVDDLDDATEISRRRIQLAAIARTEFDARDLETSHLTGALDASTEDEAVVEEATERLLDGRFNFDEFDGDATGFVLATFHRLARRLDGDESTELAADRMDMLLDAGRRDDVAALSQLVLDSEAGLPAEILDRAAQAMLRAGREDAAADLLGRWWNADPSAVPLDRRARLASIRWTEDTTTALPLVIEVLNEDPDQPDLVTTLGSTEPVELLTPLVAGLSGDDATVALLYRAAALLELASGGTEACEPLWQRIVELDGAEQTALDALIGSLRERDAIDGLRTLLQSRVNAASSEEDRVELYRLLAGAADSDAEREDYLKRCAAADLTDSGSRKGLVDIYRRSERWAEFADVAEELAGIEQDVAARVTLYRSLAGVCLQRLDDAPRAINALELLIEIDPVDENALERLESLYRGVEDWAGTARTLDARARIEQDIDRRVEMLRDLASIQEKKLQQPGEAIAALERVLLLENANFPVLEEVARLNADLGQWEDQLRALERMAGATSIKELQAEVFVRAARTMHEHLGRHRDALELLASAADTASLSDSLIALVRSAGEAASLPTALAGVLRTLIDRLADTEQRQELELEVATLLDQGADDGPAAMDWLNTLFGRHPQMGRVLDRIEELAERRQLWLSTTDTYRRLLEAADEDHEVRWHALNTLMRIAESQSRGAETAFGLMVRAAETAELRERAEAQLERIARENDLWDKHREYLLSVSEDAQDEEGRVALILRKATFEEEQMGNWEEAFDTLVDAFQDHPRNPAIRQALYRLAREHGAWDVVLKLYELLQASTSSTEKKVEFLLAMADICDTETDSPTQALAHTIRAWYEQPADEDLRLLLEKRARENNNLVDLLASYEWYADELEEDLDARFAVLGRIVEIGREAELDDRALSAWTSRLEYPAHALTELDACDAWLTERGERGRLGDAIAVTIPRLFDADLKVAFLIRRAEIAQEQGDTDALATAWEMAVDARPADLGLRRQQVDALLANGLTNDAAVALQELTRLTEESDARRTLRTELATLLGETIGSRALAIGALTQLLESEPDVVQAEADIVDLYRVEEDWEKLVTFLSHRSRVTDDHERRVELTLQAAGIVDEMLGESQRALDLVMTLGADAERMEARELRARLLSNLGDWSEYVTLLLAMADETEDDARAAIALGQAAHALENQLVYVDRAVQAWRTALDRDPSYLHGSAQLGRLLSELGEDERAVEVLTPAWERLQAADETTGHDAADVCVLLARLSDVGEERSDARLQMLKFAVVAAPRHGDARAAYEIELQRSGGIDRLLSLLDEELQAATDDRGRAIVLVKRAAALFFEGAREPEARKTLKRALEMAPNLPAAWATLGDIEFQLENFSAAFSAYRELGDDPAALSTEEFIRPRRLNAEELLDERTGALYAMRRGESLERSGYPDDAYEVYTGILLDDETYPPALAALARLSLVRQNLAGAAVHVSNYMRHASNAPRALTARVNMLAAEIAEREGHADTAMQFYDRATRDIDVAGSREAVERSAEMAIKSGDAESAIPRLQKLLEFARDDADRARILLQLGTAQAEVDGHAAASTLREAVELMADDSADVDTALTRISDAVSGMDLVDALTAVVAAVSGTRRARTQLARARAYLNETLWNEACEDAAVALTEMPWSSAALDVCIEAHSQAARSDELITAIEAALKRCPADASGSRADLLSALAKAQWKDKGYYVAAMETYRRLLGMKPESVDVLEAMLSLSNELDEIDVDEVLGWASELVRLGALSEDLLRTLQQVHLEADNIDGVVQALQVLRLANAASDKELELLASIPTQLPVFADGALAGELFNRHLRPATLHETTARIIAAASQAWLDDQTPPDIADLGVDLPAGLEVSRQFDAMKAAFGLDEAIARLDVDQEAGVRLLPANPPVFVISSALIAESNPHTLRFELARVMALARPEFAVFRSLSALDSMGFFEAALARVTNDSGFSDASLQRMVDRWNSKLAGFVPPAVDRAARDTFMSLGDYRKAMETLAIRSAVLASYDSASGFDVLVAELEETHPSSVDELRSLCDRQNTVRALVTWVLSDSYLMARRDLGLTLGK